LSLSHKYEAALELIERGLATTSRNSERIFEAELYRLKARLMLVRGGPDARTEAQSLLDQALTTARGQHAKALELRAAMDLAALWIDQGRREEALALLAPVYVWFTDGFDTQDLKRAKVLLDQLR
jgi:predicted ATPase